MNRMLIRLYLGPIFLFLTGLFSYFMLAHIVPGQLSRSKILYQLANKSIEFAPTVLFTLTGISFMFALICTYELLQYSHGKREFCSNCTGMVRVKIGRYGAYKHCLNCGKNQKI